MLFIVITFHIVILCLNSTASTSDLLLINAVVNFDWVLGQFISTTIVWYSHSIVLLKIWLLQLLPLCYSVLFQFFLCILHFSLSPHHHNHSSDQSTQLCCDTQLWLHLHSPWLFVHLQSRTGGSIHAGRGTVPKNRWSPHTESWAARISCAKNGNVCKWIGKISTF